LLISEPLESKTRQSSSNAWIILGILAVVIALATLVVLRQFRQQRTTEYEKSSTSESAGNSIEKIVRQSEKSSSSPPNTTIKDLVRAWNKGETDDIVGMFSSDGVLMIPTGSQIQSRAEVETILAEQPAGILKDTTLTNSVDDVSQPDADRAIVKGMYQIDGVKILGFTKSETGSYILHQIKREGRWLISRAEVTR
jgi:uncharacterized protein (TIGR02246 family)